MLVRKFKVALLNACLLAAAFACSEEDLEQDDSQEPEEEVVAVRQSGDEERIAIEALQLTLHPLVVENCSGCHGDSVSPQFANADPVKAYTQIISSGIVDFANASRSRPVQRLLDNHNCWSDCEEDSRVMQEAIASWIASLGEAEGEETTRLTVGGGGLPTMASTTTWVDDPELVEEGAEIVRVWEAETAFRAGGMRLEDGHLVTGTLASEFTPDEALEQDSLGRATFVFDIDTVAEYYIYMKICGSGREADSLFVRINGGQTNVWDLNKESECTWRKLRFRQFNRNDPEDPDNFRVGTGRDVQAELTPGFHRLLIIDRAPDMRIDKIAVSTVEKIPDPDDIEEGDEVTGVDLEAQPIATPSLLSIDLSPTLGIEASMLVPVLDRYDDAYLFLAPEISVSSGCVKVREVRPMVNGVFLPQHSNMTGVSKVIEAPGEALVDSAMTILKDQGAATDTFSFSFRDLKVVPCPDS